jgi:hypothetical protein
MFKLANDSSLDDMVEEFERFLKAMSFRFEGRKLEMVEEEE